MGLKIFVTWANETEAIIAQLKKRITILENSKSFSATQEAVQKVETEMLLKLRDIRESLIASSENGNAITSSSSTEIENLKSENEALKAANERLKYRVKHLVSNMEKLLDGQDM